MATSERHYATGRRKESSARVYLSPGSGRIVVNTLPADEYFKRYDRDGDGKFGANEIAAMDRRKKKEEL